LAYAGTWTSTDTKFDNRTPKWRTLQLTTAFVGFVVPNTETNILLQQTTYVSLISCIGPNNPVLAFTE
jgi:hypothetical protein